MMLTVKEISEKYGVTTMAVRYWIADGLPYKVEKIIGIKPRMIIDPKDVEVYHLNKAIKKGE